MRTQIFDFLNNSQDVHKLLKSKANIDTLTDLIVTHIIPMVKPTSKPARDIHANKIINGKVMKWCSRHKAYHEIIYFVPNKSQKDGRAPYCKAAQRKWESNYNMMKKLALELANNITNLDPKQIEKHRLEIKRLDNEKDDINTYASIPYDSCKPVELPIDKQVYENLLA